MSVPLISDRGIWLAVASESHVFDSGLAEELGRHFQGASVVDLGCGRGDYVRHLDRAGIHCDGYDGSPETELLTAGRCRVCDLSVPVSLPRTYDWVLSLEVGEHIPRPYEPTFLANIHRHNTVGVVLSWAVPGQGGLGHCNERTNAEIKRRFAQLRYANDLDAEVCLRRAATAPWFRQSLMVFRRTAATNSKC